MTLVDSTFFYESRPRESAFWALDHIRDVCGVFRMAFDANAHAFRVEFDASSLTEDDLTALLRGAGFDVRRWHRGILAAYSDER
jgi:hypothetical protein